MSKWLRRIRVAVSLGLAWAAAWVPVDLFLGLIVDSDGSMDEIWVAVGGYPGFLCGVVFSTALGVAKGRARFDELPLTQAGAVGAVSGVTVGVLPFLVLVSNETGGLRGRLLGAPSIASITLSSAVSAAGSLALANWWRRDNGSTPMQEIPDGLFRGKAQEVRGNAADLVRELDAWPVDPRLQTNG